MWGWIVGLGIFFWILLLALFIVPLVFWILKIIRLFRCGNTTGGVVVLICGLLLSPLIGLLIGLAFKEDEVEKIEKEKYFWCDICHTKYKEELLGRENYEGKICRSCLGKKQQGEASARRSKHSKREFNQTPNYQPKEEIYQSSPPRDNREKRILARELSRKQRKKNSYLTSFIVNLVVIQWLMPLITIVILWITLKEQMKVQASNNPHLGLPTEIPFKTVFKDGFKILTSDFYVYGGHNIQISLIWKIGIILAFLLPLGSWIYNLVRFLSVNEEVKQLEAEIKEL